MKKAKSRLQTQPAVLEKVKLAPPNTTSVVESKRKKSVSGRLKHWKTLAIGLFFTIGLLILVFFVEPELVQNWLVPNGYLPFFFLLFGSVFFTASFALLNSLLGFWIAFLICVFVFLKIQLVIFSTEVLVFFGLNLLPMGILVLKNRLAKK